MGLLESGMEIPLVLVLSVVGGLLAVVHPRSDLHRIDRTSTRIKPVILVQRLLLRVLAATSPWRLTLLASFFKSRWFSSSRRCSRGGRRSHPSTASSNAEVDLSVRAFSGAGVLLVPTGQASRRPSRRRLHGGVPCGFGPGSSPVPACRGCGPHRSFQARIHASKTTDPTGAYSGHSAAMLLWTPAGFSTCAVWRFSLFPSVCGHLIIIGTEHLTSNFYSSVRSIHGSSEATQDVRVDLRCALKLVLRFNIMSCRAIILCPVTLIQYLRCKIPNPPKHCPVRQSRGAPAVLSACVYEDLRCLLHGHLFWARRPWWRHHLCFCVCRSLETRFLDQSVLVF